MKYINDLTKLKQIQEMAKNGDKKAKDFLFNFMEMDDKEANEYLSQIAINDEGNEKDWKFIIEDLIADENEAIDGYDKAIKYLSNVNFTDDVVKEKYLNKLNEIKDEEIKHIEELKEIR